MPCRWVTSADQRGYVDDPYSWPQYGDYDAKLSFPKTTVDTWQIDVVSYDARREVIKYFRGGEGPGLASTLLVQKEKMVGPDGRELVLGCDYIEVRVRLTGRGPFWKSVMSSYGFGFLLTGHKGWQQRSARVTILPRAPRVDCYASECAYATAQATHPNRARESVPLRMPAPHAAHA